MNKLKINISKTMLHLKLNKLKEKNCEKIKKNILYPLFI